MWQVAEIEEAEKQKMRNKCEKIINHGVNVFVNRQLIYNFPEQVRQLAPARERGTEREYIGFGWNTLGQRPHTYPGSRQRMLPVVLVLFQSRIWDISSIPAA